METMAVPKEAGKLCLDLDALMDVDEMHAQLCTLGEGASTPLRQLAIGFEPDIDTPLEYSVGEDFGESLAEGLARLTELENLHLSGFRNLYGLDAEAAPLLEIIPGQETVFLPSLRSLDLEVNSYFADDFEAVAALPALRDLTVTWQHGFNAPMDEGALDGLTKLTQLTSMTIGHDVPLGQLTHAGVQEMPNLHHLDLTHGLRSRGGNY